MDDFVNLHVHTLFSTQDSVIKIDELVHKVKEYEQFAVAVTDHSSTSAHYYLNEACKNNNIKPIFGNEFYTNPSYEEKSRDRNHLVCLALNQEGVKNINKLQNEAVIHQYYKPIVSEEILSNYAEGIFATSACSLGRIPQLILQNDLDGAEFYCNLFSEIFDNNFALELQLHPEYQDQYKINNSLIQLSERTNIPLIVTTDAHFLTKDDMDTRKAIQCIAWKKTYDEGRESLFSNCLGNTEIILKNAELSGFDIDIIKKAIKNTNTIAQRCNGVLCDSDRKVPIFTKHEEFDELFQASF